MKLRHREISIFAQDHIPSQSRVYNSFHTLSHFSTSLFSKAFWKSCPGWLTTVPPLPFCFTLDRTSSVPLHGKWWPSLPNISTSPSQCIVLIFHTYQQYLRTVSSFFKHFLHLASKHHNLSWFSSYFSGLSFLVATHLDSHLPSLSPVEGSGFSPQTSSLPALNLM